MWQSATVHKAVAAAAFLIGLQPVAAAAQTASTTTTTQASCAYPEALERLGRKADARTEYLSILNKNPLAADCARAALVATDPCAAADALRKHGQDDEAKKAYVDVLKQDPQSACAKKHLEKPGRWSPTWIADMSKTLGSFVTLVGIGVVALAAVLLLLTWAAAFVAKIPWVGPLLRRFGPFRRASNHRLVVEPFDESGGGGAKVAVPLRMQVHREVLRTATSTMEAPGGESALAPALEGLKELGPEFKLAAALLALADKVRPVYRFTVRAAAMHGARGAGLALSFERAKEAPDGGTLWQHLDAQAGAAAPTGDDFATLVPQAGGWITFQLGRRLRPKQWVVATNAESYALARAGIVLKDAADFVGARAFLLRALELDPENVTALANLGLVDAAEGDPDTAVRRLERARNVLERKLG